MAKNELSAGERKSIDLFSKYFGGFQTRVYRATGGKLMGKLVGAPCLLLTTTGRKTGLARTLPLIYLRDGDRLMIVASKGGYPQHPAWYLNLRDKPEVTVQVGSRVTTMHARTASDEEKAHYWPLLVALYKGYEGYQRRTEREIPVVILEPVAQA